MSKNINVPKLRFKEFTEDWEDKLFGEIYTFFQTNSFSRALLNYEVGKVKNIHYGDIHTKFKSNFYLEKENVPYINDDIDISKIDKENYCKEKDLIIADASEDYKDIGKTIEIIDLKSEKLLAGLHTYIARDNKDKMALGFGGYFMQVHNIRLQIMKFATGISVLGISKSNLSKIKINIPKKQEQEKIALFLSSVDTKIEQLTKKDELLQQYKKGVMQKIFNQEIRFKADDGSEFCDWEEKKLGEIANITIGEFVIKTKQNPDALYPVYNGGKTNTGFYNEYNNEGNQVIISARGANAGFVNFEVRRYWAGNSCYSISMLDNSFYNINFYYYYIKHFENKFTDYQQAANIPSVSKKEVNDFKVITLKIEEQNKIANFLSSIDSKIEQIQKQLDSTKEFKKSLLQQMFV